MTETARAEIARLRMLLGGIHRLALDACAIREIDGDEQCQEITARIEAEIPALEAMRETYDRLEDGEITESDAEAALRETLHPHKAE